MRALLHIARTVAGEPRDLTQDDVATAQAAGATDADVQLAVLIAAAFSMYNRMVEGFRAETPPTPGGLSRARRRDRRARLQRPTGRRRPRTNLTTQAIVIARVGPSTNGGRWAGKFENGKTSELRSMPRSSAMNLRRAVIRRHASG